MDKSFAMFATDELLLTNATCDLSPPGIYENKRVYANRLCAVRNIDRWSRADFDAKLIDGSGSGST